MPIVRVGFFLTPADPTWIAGRNYMLNLFQALAKFPHPGIRPVIFHPPSKLDMPPEIFQSFECCSSMLEKRWSIPWLTRKIGLRLFGNDPLLVIFLKRHRIDVISHSEPLSPQTGIKSLCWIPDFQHKHLPQNFSGSEISKRDSIFRRYAENSSRVFLSSQVAVEDFKSAFPTHAEKARLLRFAVSIPSSYKPSSLETLMDTYGIPSRFLYLPNQFWIHKNHRTIIEALGLIAKRSDKIPIVVSTGAQHDYRHPDFFSSLQQRIKELNLEKNFICLGMVPHNHVLNLIRNSIGVINPSLYEGWSTTVEETKMLGRPMILSDIPVHREQNPPNARFFKPDDPAQAAKCMEELFATGRQELEQLPTVVGRYEDNVRAFSQAFSNTILECNF